MFKVISQNIPIRPYLEEQELNNRLDEMEQEMEQVVPVCKALQEAKAEWYRIRRLPPLERQLHGEAAAQDRVYKLIEELSNFSEGAIRHGKGVMNSPDTGGIPEPPRLA